MKRTVQIALSVMAMLLASISGYSQTTVTASTVAATNASGGANVFAVANTNSFGIAITTFSAYHSTSNNGRTYSVWYHPAALTGAPNVSAANGWILLGTSPTISGIATNQILPVLSNQYLVIPPNTTYRIAIVCNSGLSFFSTTGNNTYTAGGVTIHTGSSTTSPGYAGAFPAPTLSPRYFSGAVTFVTAVPDNIGASVLLSPVGSTAYCANDSVEVRVVLKNDGSTSASNFSVTARYTGSSTNTISAAYTGTIAAYTSDTFTVGKLNLPQGTYSVRAFVSMSSDTVKVNDTTAAVSLSFKKANTLPAAVSDTACPGDSAILFINPVIANTTYKWYNAPYGGTLVQTGTDMIIGSLTQDTVLWVKADSNNCESNPVLIIGKVAQPPAPFLGADTAFCESIPLILDAGYPGATYRWSTGDTTQTIAVTNVSGNYWVKVTQYCTRADTVNVTIRPLPTVKGISFVRMGNTYQFFPSGHQNVETFLWLFGDGASSTDSTPVHNYGANLGAALNVRLIVGNTCDKDTVQRMVPTGMNDLPEDNDALKVYPNPAHDKLSIVLQRAVKGEVTVTNMIGGVVLRSRIDGTADTLDVSGLPGGNYIIRVYSEEVRISVPLQIIR